MVSRLIIARHIHTDQSCEVYHHVYDMICWMMERGMVDIDDFLLGSVSCIYRKIVSKLNMAKSKSKYYRLLSNVLPSYLQSFNFKLHNNLLPVATLSREYALDNGSCCLFCSVGPESIFHLFGTCEKLQKIWNMISEAVFCVTQKQFDFVELRKNLLVDLVSVNLGKDSKVENFLIYLNSVVNYSIWKVRNEIKFNFKTFKCSDIIQKIIRTTRARKAVDHKLIENKRIPFLGDFCSVFLIICRKYYPFDNG